MKIFEAILDRLERSKSQPSVTVQMEPSLTADDDLMLGGLRRVMKEYSDLPRHAALRIGVVTPGIKRASVEVQVLKPCLKGLPRARTLFHGDSVAEAAHLAKLFVESILPCDDPDDP